MKLIFEIYDFDNDGFINKNDIMTIFNLLPVINNLKQFKEEGNYTKEGGGIESFS